MKKFTFLVAALCATMMASAATVTFGSEDLSVKAMSKSGITVTPAQEDGPNAPVINTNEGINTLRVYAKGSLTFDAGSAKISSITLKLNSATNAKRLTTMTASVGKVNVVGNPDWTATWTNEGVSNVKFTVGDIATLGSENTKAGQIHIMEIIVVTEGEGGSEGGGSEGGEEGGDAIVIEGLAYADAYWDTDYQYWEFDLYKDYDSESKILTYPEVYFSVTGGTETTIADDDIMFDLENDDFALYVKAAGDTIFFVDGTVSIVAKGEGVYAFDCTFEDKDGQAYTFKTEVEVYASAVTWDEATEDWVYEDVVLTDEASTAIRTVEIDNTVYARDGRIYAEEGARIYSLTGLDVTRMNGNLEGIYIVKNGNKVAKVAVAK